MADAISKSLSGFRARQRGDDEWIQSRTSSAVSFHNGQAQESDEELAELQISSILGIPLPVVQRLTEDLALEDIVANTSVSKWLRWFFSWIIENPDLLDLIFRAETLQDLFGKNIELINDPEERAEYAVPYLRKMTALWMLGKPLKDIQAALGTEPANLKTCTAARKFVLRVIPELAYLFGIPALLRQRQNISEGSADEIPPALVHLSRCVRQGFKNHEQVALSLLLRTTRLSRRQLHEKYALIKPHLAVSPVDESWKKTMTRVESAMLAQIKHGAA